FAAEVRVNGERGQLADFLLGERIERSATDDPVVVLGDDEALDFGFQPFARAADEDALFLERLDDGENAADVVDRGIAQAGGRGRPDHPAPTLAPEGVAPT